MNTLACTDKDGNELVFQYTFTVEPYDEPAEVTFTVTPVIDPYTDVFNFTLAFVGERHLKITMINANGQAIYKGKGIPDALIPEAAALFNRIVISSANGKRAGEYRTPSADVVWQRLVRKNLAVYDPAEDTYSYTAYHLRTRIDPGYEVYDFDRLQLVQKYLDMPFRDIVTIAPVWDRNFEPDKYVVIEADCNKVLALVDFLELSTQNIFNYLTGDHRYADILEGWVNQSPVSPGQLHISANGKLTFSDGRHRTLLACLLLKPTVPIAILAADEAAITGLLGQDI